MTATELTHDWYGVNKTENGYEVVRKTPDGKREVVLRHRSLLVAKMEAANLTYRARRAAPTPSED